MGLEPVLVKERHLLFVNSEREVADFYIDYDKQIEVVVLRPNLSFQETIEILSLATNYASSRSDEAKLADLETALTSNTTDHFVAQLARRRIPVIQSAAADLDAALQLVVADPVLAGLELSFELGHERGFDYLQNVTFRVASPAHFCAWHSVGTPDSRNDLYIVPAYHPDVVSTKTSIGLINGDTDALISGRTIRYVYAPAEACTQEAGLLSGSWAYANHPFYGAGQEIVLSIHRLKALSADGIKEIQEILCALLEVNDTYLGVSGGFRGPYVYPANVAETKHVTIGTWDGRVRGSEGVCVWSYQTLEQEGQLAGAYVPGWFMSEGWLKAYANYARRSPASPAVEYIDVALGRFL